MRKKGLSLLLALVLSFGLAVPAMAAGSGFTDVDPNAYYAEAVAWAVEKKITSGTSASAFSPNQTCTRAQIATFIWRAQGCPESNIGWNIVRDVGQGQYYYDAVQWLVSQTYHPDETDELVTFRPNDPCTRLEAVEFLYQFKGQAAPHAGFTDVESPLWSVGTTSRGYAVDWAVAAGVTKGTSATTFSPNDICTRGQIATFLHRAYTNAADTILAMKGTYICDQLKAKLVADIDKRESGYHFKYTFYYDTIYGEMMFQEITAGASFSHPWFYGLNFYEDFVVVKGYNDKARQMEGIYVKEGHTLPDWAKEKFADMLH